MRITQLAAQLYTVRDHCKTAADLAVTLKKVAGIGYPAVQLSGLGPIPEEDIAALCKQNGLTICATHEDGKLICNEPQKVVAKLKQLGCKHTAYPYPGGVQFDSFEDVKTLAAKLNVAGKVLADAGQCLSYHNHHIEFRKVAGKTILEWIYELTDAWHLQGEPDTYWVQTGGGEPTDWCNRLKGRLPLLHMKDYIVTAPDNKIAMAEIGNGNLNWQSIVKAAEAAGCEWFIVEQDTCPGDPFDSLQQSFEYIKQHLVS